MKYPLTFFSAVALIWCSCAVLRASLPWTVPACVVSQMAFSVVGALALQKNPPEGRAYTLAMGMGLLLVLTFAAWFALRVSEFWFAMTTLNWCFYLGLILMRHRSWTVRFFIIEAVVLAWCGILALVSLSLEMRPELYYSTLALGLYWLGTALVFFCWSVGVTRNPKLWMLIGDLAPATLAIVAFGGLAFMLWGGPQAELSQQMLPGVAQRYVEEEVR